MIFALDTNAVIAVVNGRPPIIRDRMRYHAGSGGSFVLSSIVVFELRFGIARSARRRYNAKRLQAFLSGNIAILPFEEEDATIAGELRADLMKAGTPIGPYDLLIAAQTLRVGAILITANVAEFSRIPGLQWQDWTKPD